MRFKAYSDGPIFDLQLPCEMESVEAVLYQLNHQILTVKSNKFIFVDVIYK